MRRRLDKEEDDSEINMTPMLDVVFIMLIFFIVTASFVKEAGVDVNRPPALTAISFRSSKKDLRLFLMRSWLKQKFREWKKQKAALR